ncbi:MAG TPA: YtxH domain-containing protein [Thermoanaerobaculia bacterium]|nr:YtxH domain-containing protein [Thermoanaerobaculia bacterium]
MSLFQTHSNRGRTAALLGGLGVGAALMYIFDPSRGARRRAVARDKALKYARVAGERFGKKSRDLKNRARGLAAEIRPEREERLSGDSGKA